MKWFPMQEAPRDGSLIIALWADGTGIELIRWGEFIESGGEAWFCADWSDEASEDGESGYQGWVPCPEIPNPPERPRRTGWNGQRIKAIKAA